MRNQRHQQSGVMLLEALIAILIFSLGILGVVGMQASAIAASRDAKYRSDASLLANDLIGLMWSGTRDGASLQSNFQGSAGYVTTFAENDPARCSDHPGSDGLIFCQWFNNRVVKALPGALVNPPIVTVVPGIPPGGVLPQSASIVTIRVRWMAPADAVAHSYTLVVRII
jgi:type IV pilus assembly protein PilV